MSSIAGVVDRREASVLDRARALAASLTHRGPNDAVLYSRPGVALVHRGRARDDPAAGGDVITTGDGTIGVAIDRETPPERSIGDRSPGPGGSSTVTADGDLVARLAEDSDPATLARRLDGGFAFAAWDDRRRRLVLARDRFGVKPLYYWCDGSRLVFASELKAVVADPSVPRLLEPRAIPAYLELGYVPTPTTFFEGVRSVPAAHVVVFDSLGRVNVEPYWHPPVPGIDGNTAITLGFEESRRQLRRLLCDAVDRRLASELPHGAFLTGGVDSSAVVAFMARLSPRPVRTFSVRFHDAEVAQRPHGPVVASRFHTEHTEFVVQPDQAELVERLVQRYDQPVGDTRAVASFVLAELTGDQMDVALVGEGGDELITAGDLGTDATSCLCPRGRRVSMLGRLRRGDRLGADRSGTMPGAYLATRAHVPARWRQRLVSDSADWAEQQCRAIWSSTEGADPRDRLAHLVLRTDVEDRVLPSIDGAARAYGLDLRFPFLDTEVVEFALRLPPATRVATRSRRPIHEAAVRDLVPPAVLGHRKREPEIPIDRWFRTGLQSYVRAMLAGTGSRCGKHLDAGVLDAMVTLHQAGTADLGPALWTLLTLEVFLRQQSW